MVTVADPYAGAASDVVVEFSVQDAPFPRLLAIDLPRGWDLAGWRREPGMVLGTLTSDLRVGLANGACTVPVHAEYRLLAAAASGPTVDVAHVSRDVVSDVYVDLDGNGLPQGVDQPPSFISGLKLSGTPYARAYGQSLVQTLPTFVDVIVQDRGSDGPTMNIVLNDPDYTSPTVTSMCSPMQATLTLFGVSPSQGNMPMLVNPSKAGDYTWTVRSAPPPDADGDGIDNQRDNCPLVANADQRDRDADGIGDACDPSPDENRHAGDEDQDGFPNGSDTCPLVANPDQADADLDFIGDACDDQPGSDWYGDVASIATAVTLGATSANVPARIHNLASLPPVWNPDARGGSEPNPSAPNWNPEDQPVQERGLALEHGRSDCPAGWQVVRAQGGWSVCHPASWEYHRQNAGYVGIWEEGFMLSRQGSDGQTSAELGMHEQTVGRTGMVVPECTDPAAGKIGGLPAKVCRWAPGATDRGASFPGGGVAYYVDFQNGRIALEGKLYAEDVALMQDVESIFETLRLP
jgi:hypothetical protein